MNILIIHLMVIGAFQVALGSDMKFGYKTLHNKAVADGKIEPKAACETEYGWYDGGNGNCYLFVMEYDYQYYCYYDYNYYWGYTFFQAMECCYNNGGYVAEPKSQEENDFLRTKMQNLTGIGSDFPIDSSWWIGGQDIYMEDIWNWNSGGRIAYTNWADGEPNNNGGEDCITMDSQIDFKWMDLGCSMNEHYGVPHYITCQKPYAASVKKWNPNL